MANINTFLTNLYFWIWSVLNWRHYIRGFPCEHIKHHVHKRNWTENDNS